jgi:hypothetical protein
MLRRDLLSLGALLTAGGLAAALPHADAAEAPAKRNGLLAQGVKGTWQGKGGGSGSLTADVLVQSIAVNPTTRALTVQGRIASKGGTGGLDAFVSQPFTAKAKLTEAEADGKSCGTLTLKIKTINLAIRGGLAITLSPTKLDVTGLTDGARQLANQLCLLADALAGQGSADDLAKLVARINRILASNLIVIPAPK